MGQYQGSTQTNSTAMFFILLLFGVAVAAAQLEEQQGPPVPYSFSYAAGRAPGHVDRVHAEVSDGSGVVKGMFSYVDPRHQVRTVEYVADEHGFHPLVSNPITDTKAVAQAKTKHANLYNKIAAEQQRIAAERGQSGFDDGSYREQPGENINPAALNIEHPRDTFAVNHAKARHFDLYQKIAYDHAKIAAERQLQNPDLINNYQ